MTQRLSIGFVVDDDLSVREALSSLILERCARRDHDAAQHFLEQRRADAFACPVLDVG